MIAAHPTQVGKIEIENRVRKVGFLVSHPIQYFVPVYRELGRTSGIDLTVIFRTRVGVDEYHDSGFGQLVKWDIPLTDGYKHCFLSRKTKLTGFEPGVVRAILRGRFDVLVVHGYDRLTNLAAVATAKLIGTRVLLRGDTRLVEHHREAPWWKRALKGLLIRSFDGYLSIGSLNRDYYGHFGAKSDRIYFAPFCVDNAAFRLRREDRQSARSQLRSAWGLPADCVVVLFASKLVPGKRAADLIQAFAKLEQGHPSGWLIIAGTGEEAQALKRMTSSLGLRRVRFVGFQNQSTLPRVYAACDVLVLPSEAESWGLVVNEAMAAGLPVVVSDDVGAYPDLVAGRGTGVVYPCGDVTALACALDSLLQSRQMRLEMGLRAEAVIQDWDVKACASGIVSAVRHFA